MAFQYSEPNREEYYGAGLTVLHGVIPPSLIMDLRAQSEIARGLARGQGGPQCQRLQPVYRFDGLNHRLFRDFLGLEGMAVSVAKILGADHHQSDIMGILLEPAEQAWCTNWHRDWGHHVRNLNPSEFLAAKRNPGMFNQINGALYDDYSLWVVPYSHDRPDLPEELAAFPTNPPNGPGLSAEMSAAERERACACYISQMPGATRVPLQAGDVAFYRSCGWHVGAYLPYCKRATLHDGYYCDDDYAWQAHMHEVQRTAAAQNEAAG